VKVLYVPSSAATEGGWGKLELIMRSKSAVHRSDISEDESKVSVISVSHSACHPSSDCPSSQGEFGVPEC